MRRRAWFRFVAPAASLAQATLLALALASCGGGGDDLGDEDAWREAAARADRQEAEARRLAVASPCASDAQCDVMPFLHTAPTCSPLRYHVYSRVSPTAAAASAAAARQAELAVIAWGLYPSSGEIACPAVTWLPPVPVCRANACVAR